MKPHSEAADTTTGEQDLPEAAAPAEIQSKVESTAEVEDSTEAAPEAKVIKFRVTCSRAGDKHSFSSNEAARDFGGAVQEFFQWKADMTKFDVEVVLLDSKWHKVNTTVPAGQHFSLLFIFNCSAHILNVDVFDMMLYACISPLTCLFKLGYLSDFSEIHLCFFFKLIIRFPTMCICPVGFTKHTQWRGGDRHCSHWRKSSQEKHQSLWTHDAAFDLMLRDAQVIPLLQQILLIFPVPVIYNRLAWFERLNGVFVARWPIQGVFLSLTHWQLG